MISMLINQFSGKIFKTKKRDTHLHELGLLYFINWFTDFLTENLGTEGEIKIKIKYITSTLHFIKMICNIL